MEWLRFIGMGAFVGASAAVGLKLLWLARRRRALPEALIGAGLLLRSLDAMTAVDTGFDPRGLVSARVSIAGTRYEAPRARYRFFQELVEGTEQGMDTAFACSVPHRPNAPQLAGVVAKTPADLNTVLCEQTLSDACLVHTGRNEDGGEFGEPVALSGEQLEPPFQQAGT